MIGRVLRRQESSDRVSPSLSINFISSMYHMLQCQTPIQARKCLIRNFGHLSHRALKELYSQRSLDKPGMSGKFPAVTKRTGLVHPPLAKIRPLKKTMF